MTAPGWRLRAACADVDPEIFFPVAESGRVLERQVAEAKAVCGGCPVRAECLTDALVGLPYGIAGGLTEGERHGLRTGSETPAPRLPAATQVELARAGRAAIGAGRAVAEVAAEFGVTSRTVQRWAAQVSASERGAA